MRFLEIFHIPKRILCTIAHNFRIFLRKISLVKLRECINFAAENITSGEIWLLATTEKNAKTAKRSPVRGFFEA